MQVKSCLVAAAALLACAAAGQAGAATISSSNGQYTVGIGENGELFDASSGVGYLRNSDGFDAIAAGAARDSWGVAIVGGGSAYADQSYYGSADITGTAFALDANGGTATTTTDIGLTVAQTYSFVGDGNILRIDISVTNDGLDPVSAIFQRNVDLTTDPIGFDENAFGPVGSATGVVDSSDFGFDTPDASQDYFFSCRSGCNESGDLGAGIKISLGSLLGGATRTFTYYYGISAVGQDVDSLIAQGQAAGAGYIMADQSRENGDYPALGGQSAFLGVSGGVPEPAAWALMLTGFFGLGGALRRRRAALA